MESTELYRQLLGQAALWTIEQIELDIARQHVEVYVGHSAGQRTATLRAFRSTATNAALCLVSNIEASDRRFP